MRHRIRAGKVGSFTPEKKKVEVEQLEDREVIEDVEKIFEEDSGFSNDDEALAAMEFFAEQSGEAERYGSLDEME